MSLPLPGVPVRILRTYDSRDKRPGDFGVGWRMSMSDVRVETTRVLGAHWEETSTGGLTPRFDLVETRRHLVAVAFPDGKVFKFAPAPVPSVQALSPIGGCRMDFRQVRGTSGTQGATLEALPERSGNYIAVAGSAPGFVDLIDIATGNHYNPHEFRLTTVNEHEKVTHLSSTEN